MQSNQELGSRQICPNLILMYVKQIYEDILVVFDQVNCILIALKLDLIIDQIEILQIYFLPNETVHQTKFSIHTIPSSITSLILISIPPSHLSLHGGYTQIVNLLTHDQDTKNELKFTLGDKLDGFIIKNMSPGAENKIPQLNNKKIFKPFNWMFVQRQNKKTTKITLFQHLSELANLKNNVESCLVNLEQSMDSVFFDVDYFKLGEKGEKNNQNFIELYSECQSLLYSLDSNPTVSKIQIELDHCLSMQNFNNPVVSEEYVQIVLQGQDKIIEKQRYSGSRLLILDTLSLKTLVQLNFQSFNCPSVSSNISSLSNISIKDHKIPCSFLVFENGSLILILNSIHIAAGVQSQIYVIEDVFLPEGSILIHHKIDQSLKNLMILYLERVVDNGISFSNKTVTKLRQKEVSIESSRETLAESQKYLRVVKEVNIFQFDLGNQLSKLDQVWRGRGIDGEDISVWNIYMKGDSIGSSGEKIDRVYELRYLGEGKIQIQVL